MLHKQNVVQLASSRFPVRQCCQCAYPRPWFKRSADIRKQIVETVAALLYRLLDHKRLYVDIKSREILTNQLAGDEFRYVVFFHIVIGFQRFLVRILQDVLLIETFLGKVDRPIGT